MTSSKHAQSSAAKQGGRPEDSIELQKIRTNFESPSEAIEYCWSQSDPWEAMWAIAKACVEMDEHGFASELVYESQILWNLTSPSKIKTSCV